MHFYIFTIVGICLLLSLSAQEGDEVLAYAAKPQYFFSVMVMERNQISFLLEFVRHYLEEGADHLFIYNSQNTPHVHNELDCIDSKYYTIIPHLGPINNKNDSKAIRQEVFKSVRHRTEWLAIVDSDDFIGSRAYPTQTIREILETGNHAICKVIAIPTINYAWGDTQETPTGHLRTTLTQRWGYSPEFNHSVARKSAKLQKFTESYEKVNNRVIVHAQDVASVRSNSAALTSKGTICVASTALYPSCAHFVQDVSVDPAIEDTATSTLSPPPTTSTNTHISQQGAHPVHLLPRYCPERNAYRGRRSSSGLYLLEQDIQGLSLAVHHYRIPSQTAWDQLSAQHPQSYPPEEMALANRVDVMDRYMLEREDHRKYHSLQKAADQALSACASRNKAIRRNKGAQVHEPDGQQQKAPSPAPEQGTVEKEGLSQNNLRSGDTFHPEDAKSSKVAQTDDNNAKTDQAHPNIASTKPPPAPKLLRLVRSYFGKLLG